MVEHRQGPETARLRLRALTPEEAADFYALNSHPQVLRYTGEPPLESLEAARIAIETYPDWARYGFGRWACELKESQRVIGFCGLKPLPELNEVDLGFRFLPEHWGKGLATEASLATLKFGREVLQLERIIALVLPQNAASVRVLEKPGLHFEREVEYLDEACHLCATQPQR